MITQGISHRVRWLGIALITPFLCYALLLAALSLAPKPDLFPWQSWSTAYFDRSGELLRLTLADDDKFRIRSDLGNIATEAVEAVLLYEDKDFYDHSGASLSAMLRAFWHTYVVKSRQIGGSTISMQLARMAFDIESRTIPGKLQQILYALWIERHYSKSEILELYLNNLPYGGNIEGIATASLIYFDKLPDRLNTAEALALTVIPQNPSKRYPVTHLGYQRMNEARLRLASRWLTENPLSDAEARQLQQWLELPLQFRAIPQLPFKAPHFVEHLEKNTTLPHQIKTSLNLNTQTQLETQIKEYLNAHQHLGFYNASALLINHRTMRVEAWVGSADYYNSDISGQVDGVTAKRSPGSTLKPFAYALAMDQGLIHPLSLLKDTPSRFAAYTPENYDMAYAGPINATNALITSRNVPAIRLAAQLQSPTLYQLLKTTGVTELKARTHYGLSSVLGGVEITMLELARLYAMLANNGVFQREQLVSHTQPKTETTMSLLTPESAWLTSYMLAQNPATDQTRKPRASYFETTDEQQVAWKTGTSFAFRDAWSVGYDQNYVLAVWLGNFNGEGNSNLIGREAAAPLFFKLLRSLSRNSVNTSATTELQDITTTPLLSEAHRPAALSKVAICEATGSLPGKYCPNTVKGWFIPGVSPIETSGIFRPVLINAQTGKRACRYQPGITVEEVYQFWPSDLSRLFKMAGIQHRQVPDYDAECLTQAAAADLALSDANAGLSKAPKISSPSSQLTYYLSVAGEEIPLEAVLDSQVKRAYWFANGSFIDSVATNETLFWKANPGVYQITITDDQGNSDSTHITVEKTATQNNYN